MNSSQSQKTLFGMVAAFVLLYIFYCNMGEGRQRLFVDFKNIYYWNKINSFSDHDFTLGYAFTSNIILAI